MPSPADAIIPANHGDGEARRTASPAFARLARSAKPLLLFVTHGRGGGVARHVRELAALLAPDADVLVLRPHLRSFLALEGTGKHVDARLWFHRDDQWEDLCGLLRALGVARVHYHHVQGLPARILNLGRELACPWDVTVHDYYPICPQFQLTDATGRYCGEPDQAGCTRCLAANPAQWPLSIGDWRAQFGRLLGEAARVIAPSRDAANRIARYFPALSPVCWPHVETAPDPAPARKVLVLGGLSSAKGMDLLEACAREARNGGRALAFRVIGHLARPVDEEDLRLSFTGEFPEGTLGLLLDQERGDAIFFPAQWPETYSYTLTAALDSGLPIVSTDLGALPERLAHVPNARTLAWNTAASEFNDALEAATGKKAIAAPGASPREDAARYRARYLEGLEARPATPADAGFALPGMATRPGEAMPEATLVELFDDGVRCGNGGSTGLLRERVARADRDLAQVPLLRERLGEAQVRLADTLEQVRALRSDLEASRETGAVPAALKARVAAIEASTSWRITAPLRALARLFRR